MAGRGTRPPARPRRARAGRAGPPRWPRRGGRRRGQPPARGGPRAGGWGPPPRAAPPRAPRMARGTPREGRVVMGGGAGRRLEIEAGIDPAMGPDGVLPPLEREIVTVPAVDHLPFFVGGRLRVDDEPVEVQDERRDRHAV